MLSPSATLRAQHTGVQIVGLNRCTEADRDVLAKLLRRAQADIEVSFLPFEFTFEGLFPKLAKDQTPDALLQETSTKVFSPAQRLVAQYFAQNDGAAHKLTMTVCLHFYYKTSKYPGTSFRWNAFDDGKVDRYKPTPAEKKADASFREQSLARVRATGLWMQKTRQWSIEKNGPSRNRCRTSWTSW